ncbi:MAG: fumarylacetoacetate hydrolase family protein [Acidobacteriota bacterium]
MRIANILHKDQQKLSISAGDQPFIDFTAALQAMEAATSGLAGRPIRSIQDLLDSGRFELSLFKEVLAFVAAHKLEGHVALGRSDVQILAPFDRPGQIIALARNYTVHAQESTLPLPREPIFFSKSNTSVIGPGETIVLPPNLGRIEPEIELAVVVRKKASHVSAAVAEDYIAGYTILNDVSAQELQASEIKESYPLFRCKSLKTFTPMGPYLVTVDEVGLSPALNMTLRVNGELRVVANTSGLTFDVAQLLAFISGYLVLYPGDVITTGCPKAAGAIRPGDEVTLEIEKIGVLQNPVVVGFEACPVQV